MSDSEPSSDTQTPTYAEFYDPRLVAIYDTVCPIDGYRDFYLRLAARLSAGTIVDLGCGSGLLSCALAQRGYRVVGVEPSAAMLALARQRRPCGEMVTWIVGGAECLGRPAADLALLTGHVAQFFLDAAAWHAALTALHGALRPGGHLAFESRNPLVQPWSGGRGTHHTDWPTKSAPRLVHDPVAGQIAWWSEQLAVSGNRARYAIHYRFAQSGEELISTNELIFRSQDELRASLAAAGFTVQHIYGDWDGQPATPSTPELIVVARR